MLWFDLELCRRQTNKGAHSFVVASREEWAFESLGLGGWAPGSRWGSAGDQLCASVPLFSHLSKGRARVGAHLGFVILCIKGHQRVAVDARGQGTH